MSLNSSIVEPFNWEIDRLGQPCEKCKEGTYVETSLFDDWDGFLHCNRCDHKVIRHESMKKY